MNAQKQREYFAKVKKTVKGGGFSIAWILGKTGISRGHWYFLKEGLRPLTDDNKKAIDKALTSLKEII